MKTWTKINELNKEEITSYDIVMIAQVFDPLTLSFTDDIANRYKYQDLQLINKVKTVFMQNGPFINWQLSKDIHNTLSTFNISVEKDWSHLLKLRAFAEKIREKMFTDSKLLVMPNLIKVDSNMYSQSVKKVYGTNLLLETLFGIDMSKLKEKHEMWNQLVHVWLYLAFKYSQPMTKNWMEHFIYDNAIYEQEWLDYFKIEAESEWRVLGLYVPPLNKNFKNLNELLDLLILEEKWWVNHAELKYKWLEFKNNLLNKKIILQTIQENLENNALLKGVKHLIADQIDAREYEYKDLRKELSIPSRNKVLDLPITVVPSYWVNDNKDFTYILTCKLNDKEIGDIVIELGWHQIGPARSLSHKLKFQNFNLEALANV